MRGNIRENIEYCSKDGDYYTNSKYKIYKGEDLPKTWTMEQRAIINSLELPTNDREIHYIYAPYKSGKTKICKYLTWKNGGKIIYGTTNDCLYNITEQDNLILVNIPKNGRINWGLIEMLKDGIFYSPKYEGRQVIMAPPRIAIFKDG